MRFHNFCATLFRPNSAIRPGALTFPRRLASGLSRPSPPALPREQQREFEELQRAARTPLAFDKSSKAEAEAELALHPDARKPVPPEFEGDVNPVTGEEGGPKREPVGKWGEEGDWSFKGRVSDF